MLLVAVGCLLCVVCCVLLLFVGVDVLSLFYLSFLCVLRVVVCCGVRCSLVNVLSVVVCYVSLIDGG